MVLLLSMYLGLSSCGGGVKGPLANATDTTTGITPVITQGQNVLITMSEDGAPIAFSTLMYLCHL